MFRSQKQWQGPVGVFSTRPLPAPGPQFVDKQGSDAVHYGVCILMTSASCTTLTSLWNTDHTHNYIAIQKIYCSPTPSIVRTIRLHHFAIHYRSRAIKYRPCHMTAYCRSVYVHEPCGMTSRRVHTGNLGLG